MLDNQRVRHIVEIVTREVLVALAEDEKHPARQHGEHCTKECADGICVQTCYDHVGKVISAGAERVSSTLGGIPSDPSVAKLIDHTLLKPDATPDQVAQLCYEARTYGFASVCVNRRGGGACARGGSASPKILPGFSLGGLVLRPCWCSSLLSLPTAWGMRA